jgi:hypothetical protein
MVRYKLDLLGVQEVRRDCKIMGLYFFFQGKGNKNY